MTVHPEHPHVHGPACDHPRVQHADHADYLHDGHLHHQDDGRVEEHRLDVDETNPSECTPRHGSGEHEAGHQHGPDCEHPAVPHGDHMDYVVAGHLHHPHGEHCDVHGTVHVRET